MQEKMVKVEVEKRVYVSDDGAEFDTPQDCLEHEEECRERFARAIAKKLPSFVCSPDWIDPDYSWDWYFVSSELEFAAVLAAVFNNEASAHEYKPVAYPCWICCANDADGYGYILGTPKEIFDSLDGLKKFITEEMAENGKVVW